MGQGHVILDEEIGPGGYVYGAAETFDSTPPVRRAISARKVKQKVPESETLIMPELGQICAGREVGEFACPPYVEAALEMIATEIERVLGNIHQRWIKSPMRNAAENYENKTFEAHAYWWGDEDAPEANRPNFKCGDVEVRWYKYCGRGMSTNKKPDPVEWASILERCLTSVREDENKLDKDEF